MNTLWFKLPFMVQDNSTLLWHPLLGYKAWIVVDLYSRAYSLLGSIQPRARIYDQYSSPAVLGRMIGNWMSDNLRRKLIKQDYERLF